MLAKSVVPKLPPSRVHGKLVECACSDFCSKPQDKHNQIHTDKVLMDDGLQALYGKCNDTWLFKANFCASTCGRCRGKHHTTTVPQKNPVPAYDPFWEPAGALSGEGLAVLDQLAGGALSHKGQELRLTAPWGLGTSPRYEASGRSLIVSVVCFIAFGVCIGIARHIAP